MTVAHLAVLLPAALAGGALLLAARRALRAAQARARGPVRAHTHYRMRR